MRRVVLLLAVVASVALAGWSIATTRPAGTAVAADRVAVPAPTAAADPSGAVVASVSGAHTVEVAVPTQHSSNVRSARQPSRLLLGGLAAALAILLGLGLVRPPAAGRRPSLRHRIGRASPPFSVALLRGPPSVTARLLQA